VQREDQAVPSRQSRMPRTAPGECAGRRIDFRVQSRKCIACSWFAQTCVHVLRRTKQARRVIGPRVFVYTAALEMHPLDTARSSRDLKKVAKHRLLPTSPSAAPKVCQGASPHDNADHVRLKERVATASTIRFDAHVSCFTCVQPFGVSRETSMFELKHGFAKDAIPRALGAAPSLRMLNEPREGGEKSICLDCAF